jgi:SHOCT-like protein
MSDDTRRILDMLAQGKLTVDEADQLLRAIGSEASSATTTPPETSERRKPRYVRISVHKPAHDGGKDKDVHIRVPIAVVKSGMKLGAMIPDLANEKVAARLRERGFDCDFSKMDPAAFEAMMLELGDADINIDAGKAQVKISCE